MMCRSARLVDVEKLFDKIERDDPRMRTPAVSAFISGASPGCVWDDFSAIFHAGSH